MLKNHYQKLMELIPAICVIARRGKRLDVYGGIELAANILMQQAKKNGKVFFIGNGASAAIASHMAVDFWKNGKIQSLAFNDSPLLTCISNDFGYKHVFRKPIEMFARPEDILVAISSSGKSENIISATKAALKIGCKVITLSGFKSSNPLSRLGDLNFYVPIEKYSHVEIIHHSICHYILDTIIEEKKKKKDQ